MAKIRKIHAREVLDSRGFPTVEVEVTVDSKKESFGSSQETVTASAMVPSGASTGEGEALELRDGDRKRFLGKGVLNAVRNVHEKIAPALLERDFALPVHLDDAMRDLDGTPNKSKLGANAILAVSMAFVKAAALAKGTTTDQYLASIYGGTGTLLPVPLMNILNGGKHADNGLAIQEFMIVPAGFEKFSEALRAGVEVFHRLRKILHDKGLSTGVGDEGGFAPAISEDKPHEQALTFILQAISDAGYKPGKEIFLALDCAASEFGNPEGGYLFEGKRLSSNEMVAFYSDWLQQFPIISIEDGLSEHDWAGWQFLTEKLGSQCQLVGDDIFVTNPIFLKNGIERKVANSILIKLNQIGTVTETLETMKMAAQAGYNRIASHRSGETEDSFIADLAVATDCGQIKTGSASRSDRLAKYNQLLRLEERLGDRARFAGIRAFYRAGKFN
ncbi:MAG: phosphopyruvate hydratase [Bdellovibrio sp.]|nr:phosphopyruvate hydratase [Bdellovibrio sp.]